MVSERFRPVRCTVAAIVALAAAASPAHSAAQTVVANNLTIAAGANQQTWYGTVTIGAGAGDAVLTGSLTIAAPVACAQPGQCASGYCAGGQCAPMPPGIAITGVTQGEITNSIPVTVCYSATDPGLTNALATIDGVQFSGSCTNVLSERAHSVVVWASALSGASATDVVDFTIDLTPPQIVSTSSTGPVTSSSAATLVVNASDDYGVASVTVNGALMDAGPDGRFYFSGTLHEGDNVFVVTAVDRAGNPAVSTHVIIRDTKPPTLAVSQPAEESLFGLDVPVAGRVSDANPGVVTINGAVVATASDGSFRTTVNLPDGTQTVTIRAVDAAGNASTVVRHVVVATCSANPCDCVVVDDGNPCTVDSCDPITGISHLPAALGTPCPDGDVCNGEETCDGAGRCLAGPPPLVDDSNPCTMDSCDPVRGIEHVLVSAGSSCADGNACNGVEVCNGSGTCRAGLAPAVDDGNPCTTDACDPKIGVTHAPAVAGTSCSDGNVCNGIELCDGAGACHAGTPLRIDDGDDCTQDVCDPVTGVAHLRLGTAACACVPDPRVAFEYDATGNLTAIVNTKSDVNNCGCPGYRCATACGATPACVEGVCTLVLDDGRYVDPSSDPLHCGNFCASCPGVLNGAPVCESGVCGIQCDSGFALVADQCVDVGPVRLASVEFDAYELEGSSYSYGERSLVDPPGVYWFFTPDSPVQDVLFDGTRLPAWTIADPSAPPPVYPVSTPSRIQDDWWSPWSPTAYSRLGEVPAAIQLDFGDGMLTLTEIPVITRIASIEGTPGRGVLTFEGRHLDHLDAIYVMDPRPYCDGGGGWVRARVASASANRITVTNAGWWPIFGNVRIDKRVPWARRPVFATYQFLAPPASSPAPPDPPPPPPYVPTPVQPRPGPVKDCTNTFCPEGG